DGVVSISDAIMIRRYLFVGGAVPTCQDAADVDDSGQVFLTDHNVILSSLFNFGQYGWHRALPAPFPSAGPDPTFDDLPCDAYEVVAAEETQDVIRIGEVQGS